MHKLILWFFENINNIIQTLSLICSFFIMMIVIYWLEVLVNAQWNWLNFIKPVLDFFLDFSDSIFPFSITIFGTVFDIKFITAAIVLICIMILLRFLSKWLSNLKYLYFDLHNTHKKSVEKQFNKQMKNEVISEEMKISKYMVLINTKLKKKFNHEEINIDVNEHIDKMNKLLLNKTGVKYEKYNEGFLYKYENFNKIDNILEVLFKILKSNSPLDYSICIQTEWNEKKLDRLDNLKFYGKIILCADTLLRYKCNKYHRYGTQNLGIFQISENLTIEVHEFNEIM